MQDVERAIEKSGFDVTCVISGGAIGVDTLGVKWARENRKEVILRPADWQRYGKRAGYVRNVEMAQIADAVICVWDGKSLGTRMMIGIARRFELPLHVHHISHNPLYDYAHKT